MIHSMTAFARQETKSHWGSITWEIRSVNHRYLELQFKLPESMRHLEPRLRDQLRKTLGRGKVECSLRLQTEKNASHELKINESLVNQLLTASQTLQQQHRLEHAAPLNILEVLKWPGVLETTETDNKLLEAEALQVFAKTLDELQTTRCREGEELHTFISQRLTSVQDITDAVRSSMPEIMTAQRERLHQRIGELVQEVNTERLEQELALLANKIDVDEELDRLTTHTNEVARILENGGACGRRLDFLMQELNREANTLSSKSVVSDSTRAAIELKVLIEQMREQIQNIE